MKKAIEWLANGLPKIDFEDDPYYRELFNIAKELEKQQIIEFAVWFNNNDNSYKSYTEIIKQYYNEKFKNK